MKKHEEESKSSLENKCTLAAALLLASACVLSGCNSSGKASNGGKSGKNPYQPGTTKYERYERLYK